MAWMRHTEGTRPPRLVAQYRKDVDLLLDRRVWLEMQQP
jgi:hypothetical protein